MMKRSKKIFSVILSFLILFAASAVVPEQADARRGGSGPRTYAGTPNKSQNIDSIRSGMRSNSNPSSRSGYARTHTNNRGILGGTFFRGLFFGGIAGLLFGSLFVHMGVFGGLLGLLVNVLVFYMLFAVIRTVYLAIRDNRRRSRERNRRR
ncbi:hypothetical protein [Saccharibacillus qingshengii]|uniref:hypothetical protein n=1 Tax=Saccharibacillus qingshengii TaxID=1763540 RepID=UPI0015543189|nr:hypothetical protein [Saccharibacillus qingshengii]